MLYQARRRLAAKTPIYDHGGGLHGFANPAQAQRLIDSGKVIVGGSHNRVRSLRFKGPDPANLMMAGSRYRRPVGTPHRNENYYNVRNVWTIDRIPESYRLHFMAVVHGQLVTARLVA